MNLCPKKIPNLQNLSITGHSKGEAIVIQQSCLKRVQLSTDRRCSSRWAEMGENFSKRQLPRKAALVPLFIRLIWVGLLQCLMLAKPVSVLSNARKLDVFLQQLLNN